MVFSVVERDHAPAAKRQDCVVRGRIPIDDAARFAGTFANGNSDVYGFRQRRTDNVRGHQTSLQFWISEDAVLQQPRRVQRALAMTRDNEGTPFVGVSDEVIERTQNIGIRDIESFIRIITWSEERAERSLPVARNVNSTTAIEGARLMAKNALVKLSFCEATRVERCIPRRIFEERRRMDKEYVGFRSAGNRPVDS